MLEYLSASGIEVEGDKVKYLRNHVGTKRELSEADVRNMLTPLAVVSSQKQLHRESQSRLNSTISCLPTQTKTNFLSVKYQPRTYMTQTGFMTKKEPTERRNENKENAETLDLQISRSIVK